MIKIKEPRYRDRKVLIARYKIPCGTDFRIEIEKGAYKGIYKVSNELVCKSPIESMKTRAGAQMQMRAVSLDELERVEDEDDKQVVE